MGKNKILLPEEFETFGKEWKTEIMKIKKIEIVNMLALSLKESSKIPIVKLYFSESDINNMMDKIMSNKLGFWTEWLPTFEGTDKDVNVKIYLGDETEY